MEWSENEIKDKMRCQWIPLVEENIECVLVEKGLCLSARGRNECRY